MKFLEKISPKHFRSAVAKKRSRRSVSRSEPTSFSSGSSSSSSSSSDVLANPRSKGVATPTSVLRSEISGDWADSSRYLAPDARFELVQAFKLIDRDGDGKITRRELASVLLRVGPDIPSDADLASMLGEVDRDGDGCISLEEFGAIGPAFGPARGSELREAFDLFDRDGDGRITAEELLQMFEAIGDDGCTIDDCRRMIDGVNKAGDGFVCFEDFTRMMEQQA